MYFEMLPILNRAARTCEVRIAKLYLKAEFYA